MPTENEIITEKNGEYYVSLKHSPRFTDLHEDVKKCYNHSTWWEKYGVDDSKIAMGLFLLLTGVSLMSYGGCVSSVIAFICGFMLYGTGHMIVAAKGGHLAAHDAMAQNKNVNLFLSWLLAEFLGGFSQKVGLEIHIKYHHPHTNIIGLGDSSTWKLPLLPRYLYMFFAPLLMPLATPLVSVSNLWGRWFSLVQYVLWATIGTAVSAYLPLVCWGNFSPLAALLIIFTSRALFFIPYIHFNIFQHIGLPMYSRDHRPSRLYQMSSGALNLARNPVLDFVFGHSLINCHVEHHLFPHLSDNMCLKVKPLVSKFLRENGLPYNEESYSKRLRYFLDNYQDLMVNAPPMTHFVGLQ